MHRENIQVIVIDARNFFSLFNRNAKIHSSGTAKSRRDEAKRMSYSDSAAKKHRKWSHSSFVYFKIFSCNAVIIGRVEIFESDYQEKSNKVK